MRLEPPSPVSTACRTCAPTRESPPEPRPSGGPLAALRPPGRAAPDPPAPVRRRRVRLLGSPGCLCRQHGDSPSPGEGRGARGCCTRAGRPRAGAAQLCCPGLLLNAGRLGTSSPSPHAGRGRRGLTEGLGPPRHARQGAGDVRVQASCGAPGTLGTCARGARAPARGPPNGRVGVVVSCCPPRRFAPRTLKPHVAQGWREKESCVAPLACGGGPGAGFYPRNLGLFATLTTWQT